MPDDRLTINVATICLVREILIAERREAVTMEEAAHAVKGVLPYLTGKKQREQIDIALGDTQ